MQPAITRNLDNYQNYDLLRVYGYYRLILSGLLWFMFANELAPNVLGTDNPALFSYSAISYTIINFLTLVILLRRQFSPRTEQIFAILLIDICAITLFLYASGGIESGLGYLLVVCVAAGSIFISGQVSIALAALASILVITQGVVNVPASGASNKELFSSGTLGILLFITSLTFQYLTNKIRFSNIQAEEKTLHAAHLEKLAQLIVERMRTGIIVVNKHNTIELCNLSAAHLLGLASEKQLIDMPLAEFSELNESLHNWKANPHTRPPNIKTEKDGLDIRVSFAQLENRPDSDTLIFAEDSRLMTQEAQQLKLASLGRLTASIAHEIRNPLGAISHASQLLNESPNLHTQDQRLSEIIQNHSKRVNHIIENILQLSRRKSPHPTTLEVEHFLSEFISEFTHNEHAVINLSVLNENIRTKADASQLTQVLTNLCENGLRYSEKLIGKKLLEIVAGIDSVTELPYIEVVDEGAGIDQDAVPHIFEPFFTTETTGSGLGLYISKELCEANQASLHYKLNDANKSCFRIDLAHHQRVF